MILIFSNFANEPLSANFNAKEFACTCCGYALVDTDLIVVLERFRSMIQKPLKVTSGYRCPKRNYAIGGAELSRHLAGLAADVTWKDAATVIYKQTFRDDVRKLSDNYPLFGAGWGTSFIHLDTDRSRKQFTSWVY